MVRTLLFLFFFLNAFKSNAQFNDNTHHRLNYTSTGSLNKTNDSRAYLLNNALRFGIRKKAISLNSSNSWVYGKQNNQLTNNDFSSTLDFNLYKTLPHFFYWGLANYNTSKSLKITSQLLAGAGIAYSIYDRENAYLNLSNGLLFDSSDLLLQDGTSDIYQTTRNSLRLSFRFAIWKTVVFSGSGFYQVSLRDGRDYILKSDAALSLKINRWLSFTTAYNYNRLSRTDRQNSLLSYGLTFERYF